MIWQAEKFSWCWDLVRWPLNAPRGCLIFLRFLGEGFEWISSNLANLVQTCSRCSLKILNWRPVDLHGSWLMWHPKFYLAFSKLFLVLREVICTFLLKETSLSTYFLLWLVLHFWIHSKLDFWSWRFSSFIWTQTKMFFSWKKMSSENFFKRPYSFWNDLFPLWKIPLAMSYVQILFHKLFPTFGSWCTSTTASWTSPYVYFPVISHKKQFLPSILILGGFQRSYSFCFEFCLQTNFPT